jgi:hypothetical protein
MERNQPVISQIAPVTVYRPGSAEVLAARAPVQVEPALQLQAAPARPNASIVALAPAAMSALIEAQEHMAGEATSSDLDAAARKIDHLLARLTDTRAAQPAAQPAAGDFSIQMLMTVREQLRETIA